MHDASCCRLQGLGQREVGRAVSPRWERSNAPSRSPLLSAPVPIYSAEDRAAGLDAGLSNQGISSPVSEVNSLIQCLLEPTACLSMEVCYLVVRDAAAAKQ